ncbi:MAG: hypothetical protein ACREFC_12460, partial [Stellaceae bacterium]
MAVTDLDGVVSHGLCAGCGICQSMAGISRVEMRLTSFGQIRPQTKAPLEQAEMARILAVCPGLHINGPAPFAAGEAGEVDPVFGPIKSLDRIWA